MASAPTVVTKLIKKERKSTDLTGKEINMLKATTKMSEKEIKLWHTEFIHKYPTGKLDKDTFASVYKQLYPQNESVLAQTTLFNDIDTSKDGTIDFNEFLFFAAVSSRSSSLDERLDLIFDLWDVSGNGLLDQSEMAHLISAMYDRSGKTDRQGNQNPHKRAKEIIAKLDITGDKQLNRDEFIKGCKNDEAIRALLSPDH